MNNFANLDTSAKSLYDVSLGTQRKGLMEKNEAKNSHATIPLIKVGPTTSFDNFRKSIIFDGCPEPTPPGTYLVLAEDEKGNSISPGKQK